MANPQKEHGYTAIANEILDVLCCAGLNGSQFRIILAILRYTYGFGRKSAQLSNAFLAKETGIDKTRMRRELKKLAEWNVVRIVVEPTYVRATEWALNKDYETWDLPWGSLEPVGANLFTGDESARGGQSAPTPGGQLAPTPGGQSAPPSINKTIKKTIKQEGNRAPPFKKPSIEEIATYCEQRRNGIDAEGFYAFYESKGWMVGKNKMKDWKASVITWEKRNRNERGGDSEYDYN